jgi:hypothetical protein
VEQLGVHVPSTHCEPATQWVLLEHCFAAAVHCALMHFSPRVGQSALELQARAEGPPSVLLVPPSVVAVHWAWPPLSSQRNPVGHETTEQFSAWQRLSPPQVSPPVHSEGALHWPPPSVVSAMAAQRRKRLHCLPAGQSHEVVHSQAVQASVKVSVGQSKQPLVLQIRWRSWSP